jgi:hypothetical protein
MTYPFQENVAAVASKLESIQVVSFGAFGGIFFGAFDGVFGAFGGIGALRKQCYKDQCKETAAATLIFSDLAGIQSKTGSTSIFKL